MDAFTWIIIAALGVCVAMHFFGHSHGHAGGAGHQADGGKEKQDRHEPKKSGRHASHAGSSGHRRGGCH